MSNFAISKKAIVFFSVLKQRTPKQNFMLTKDNTASVFSQNLRKFLQNLFKRVLTTFLKKYIMTLHLTGERNWTQYNVQNSFHFFLSFFFFLSFLHSAFCQNASYGTPYPPPFDRLNIHRDGDAISSLFSLCWIDNKFPKKKRTHKRGFFIFW